MKTNRSIPIFDPLGSRNRRYATLSLSLLSMLAACEGPPSASISESAPNDEFVAAVLEAKATHTGPEIEGELRRIQREFGYSDRNLDTLTSPDVPKAQQIESTSHALVESPIAFDQTYSNTTELAAFGFRKNIAIRKAGNIVRITAEAFGNSDPMLFLIRFDDPYYQSTGFLSASGQNSFRIAAMDDDGLGRLGSTITWQSGDSDTGRYMIVAAPYANASRGRTVIRYQQTPPDGDCGPDGAWCEFYQTTDPQLDTLTGGILRGYGGNRFEVLSATGGVDPYLFVFNGSQSRGSANDDNIGLNSAVKLVDYSIPQPPASAYDFVLLSGYSGSGTVNYRQGFESDPQVLAFRANPGCSTWKERRTAPPLFGLGTGSSSSITLGEDGTVLTRSGIRDFVVTPGYLRTASFSFKKEQNNALRYLLYVDGASCPSQVIEQSAEDVVRFTMSALEPGREYRVSISAVFNSGESLPSPSLTFKTITKPRAPTNLVLVSSQVDPVDRSRIEIKLRWDDNEPEEQEYRVMLNSSAYHVSSANGIGTATITVNNNVMLAVSVIAWNGFEASDPSNVLRFTSGPGVTVTPSGGTTNSIVNTVPLDKWLAGDDVASRRFGYRGTFPFSGLSQTGRFEVQKVNLVFPVGSVVRLAKAGTLNCNAEGYIELTTGNSVVQGAALDRLFGSSNRIADDLHHLTLSACVTLPANIQHVPDNLLAQVTFLTLN